MQALGLSLVSSFRESRNYTGPVATLLALALPVIVFFGMLVLPLLD